MTTLRHRFWPAIIGGASLAAVAGTAVESPALGPATGQTRAGEIAALFPHGDSHDFAVPQPGTYALPPIRLAPDGAVLDHAGTPRRLIEVLQGRISLVSFVYLNCADTQGCPLAMGTLFDIFHASRGAPELRDRVQLVTVSFDPVRDTPAAMAAAATPVLADSQRDLKLPWHFLTTRSAAELAPLLSGFGQTVDRSGDPGVLNHLLRLFLVDARGRIRNIYGLGMIDPRLVMADVESLLMETPGG